MKDPGAGIISPKTDRHEIALHVTSADSIPDDRFVKVKFTPVCAPDDMEVVL